jgi:hypothetical protein
MAAEARKEAADEMYQALKIAAVRFDSLARMDSRELTIKSCAEGAAADVRAALAKADGK